MIFSNNPSSDTTDAQINEQNMLKKPWLRVFAFIVLVFMSAATGLSVLAQAKTQSALVKSNNADTTALPADLAAIKNAFELKFEQSKVKNIRKTPFKDIYELQLNQNELVYTNATTDFVMVGHLINTQDMRNLTQERAEELAKIDFKSLPLAQSFVLTKGDGSRQIAIFEDPNCGYCKLFRKTLEKTDNIKVYTFVIDILGPDSTAKAKQLLCAKDPVHAWDNWMLHNEMPAQSSQCDTSILEKNRQLAASLGVTGTPTIFFVNGTRAPGAIPPEDFQQRLANSSK
ncbi:DsbC family protein [Hydromonas duriensis]|uniref:Thiol:disulfide interchange protein n=1 Tax=Hydromonas duriensis TaxID=1527608 RepID=A0A4V3DK71_9BURK|nr:DsbC family protein [Hydromonas duriensis]TDR33020.1 thiol:disulfide interchange protein DsbC [Hydromonas duriensis]